MTGKIRGCVIQLGLPSDGTFSRGPGPLGSRLCLSFFHSQHHLCILRLDSSLLMIRTVLTYRWSPPLFLRNVCKVVGHCWVSQLLCYKCCSWRCPQVSDLVTGSVQSCMTWWRQESSGPARSQGDLARPGLPELSGSLMHRPGFRGRLKASLCGWHSGKGPCESHGTPHYPREGFKGQASLRKAGQCLLAWMCPPEQCTPSWKCSLWTHRL